MHLSYEKILVFVLHSGCVGRLTSGRIEHEESTGLRVYSPYPATLNEYISGANLRSWLVAGADGQPIGGWASILPEDHPRMLAALAP